MTPNQSMSHFATPKAVVQTLGESYTDLVALSISNDLDVVNNDKSESVIAEYESDSSRSIASRESSIVNTPVSWTPIPLTDKIVDMAGWSKGIDHSEDSLFLTPMNTQEAKAVEQRQKRALKNMSDIGMTDDDLSLPNAHDNTAAVYRRHIFDSLPVLDVTNREEQERKPNELVILGDTYCDEVKMKMWIGPNFTADDDVEKQDRPIMRSVGYHDLRRFLKHMVLAVALGFAIMSYYLVWTQ